MRVLRASELGSFLYCQRAWWYNSQGIEPENKTELAAGSDFHRRHGAGVWQARLLSGIGYFLLAAALVTAAVALTLLVFK
jgi:CRISPR/Cas system-associated exonuclease Cas4 (RecB family)